ncbi:sulfate/molybdate ABC transporter ATP-binding protein [Tahibacter soli]|jgi:sulfate transport system ATP-binding protein|uniref:Sulfate ABC transporter ATP-binding protein n=1 Tax=Tahibacter soli TaxID=2983605 RepID=A0A9X3YJZ2_9GAMM|nr:sulfate ABC transporter ATP-binding protein [Tahibacter soli]MDC8013761.1 sulfate ABC transporter ATP-binding protein [Tahibacter soli]
MTLELSHLHRRFADFRALDDVSLSIAPGEFVALLGPSGSGKTTLLRILAGLDFPDAGDVRRDGRDLLSVSARERGVGLVFQHYALFRHMTVFENIAFGLRVRPRAKRPSRAEIAERVEKLLKRVQLDGLGNRYPAQLSGGQRQRVALARALAIEPDLLLLDEPFGALDAQVRVTLRRWLRHLHEELGLTTVFVTHDQEEALELADRVVVMNQGRIEQVGTPDEVYQQPGTPFVFEFIGRVNKIPVKFAGGRVQAGDQRFDADPLDGIGDGSGVAYVRPEHLAFTTTSLDSGWKATLGHVFFAGSVAHVEIEVPALGLTLDAELGGDEAQRRGLAAGMSVTVQPRHLTVFAHDPKTGQLDPSRRRVVHPRYGQAALARMR